MAPKEFEFWSEKRVLITGHTGFKGPWLALWLEQLGADVIGLALKPETDPSLFKLLKLEDRMQHYVADINDRAAVQTILDRHRPEIIFHMAAQSIVRRSYRLPIATYATNVLGVITLLDVVRMLDSVKAVVVVTSDKCYENHEWIWGYRESDAFGGDDPYSSSKGCAEIATASMRRSFFAPYAKDGHRARIASVRAGNVIGGGDWTEDQLIPDIIRGCLGPDGLVNIRNPNAVRPWQHVLESLAGYLEVGERLVTCPDGIDSGWNFGPEQDEERTVGELAERMVQEFGRGRLVYPDSSNQPHEASILRLDSSKARTLLRWKPRLSINEAIAMTAAWYKAWQNQKDMIQLTRSQIAKFMDLTCAS